jgi:hypothetical protein
MVFLNRSIFRTTGSPTTTCRFFCAQIEIETDRDLSDDLPTAASGALMAMPRDPFVREKIHQGAHGRQKAGRGLFRPLPKRPVPDRSRELAPSAIAKHRIHHEAVRFAATVARGHATFATKRALPQSADTFRRGRRVQRGGFLPRRFVHVRSAMPTGCAAGLAGAPRKWSFWKLTCVGPPRCAWKC